MSEGELRERLAQLMCTFAYKAERMSLAEIVGDVRVDEIDTRRPRVDMILAEIDAAGYVIVPTDRLERLIEAATMYESDLLETCGQYTGLTRHCTSVLELGDLERIGGGR